MLQSSPWHLHYNTNNLDNGKPNKGRQIHWARSTSKLRQLDWERSKSEYNANFQKLHKKGISTILYFYYSCTFTMICRCSFGNSTKQLLIYTVFPSPNSHHPNVNWLYNIFLQLWIWNGRSSKKSQIALLLQNILMKFSAELYTLILEPIDIPPVSAHSHAEKRLKKVGPRLSLVTQPIDMFFCSKTRVVWNSPR